MTQWGTRAFLSTNYTHSDKYKGGGTIERTGVDFRVYQPLRDKDFISVAATYNSNRPYFYYDASLAQYAAYGRQMDYNVLWAVPTVTPGKADGIGGPSSAGTSPAFLQGNDSNFWGVHPNPVDFGDIRVQSRFDLSHGFTLTFDPYFFYTLANGGGTVSLSETDKRLAGASGKPACVDLNSDGDCLDTVLMYAPSNTQTHRLGLNTSILFDLDDHNHFQLGYTLDHGNHRQTGAYGLIDQNSGMPLNPFGGLKGQTTGTLDGSYLRSRDRFSVAELNQIAFNYIGRYLDDKLHVNVGVRNPVLTRKLNQYCYNYGGTNQYCDTVDPSLVQAAYNADLALARAPGASAAALTSLLGVTISTGNAGVPNFRFPFKQTYTYRHALPNAGASYNFDPSNQVYITYSQGFSAPRTDNLYTSSSQTVQPELTDNYGIGYRYQTGSITASVNPWYSVWTNHIVSSPDRTDPTISIDRNVGKVTLYGVDLEAGFRPVEHMTVYASAAFMQSKLENNYTLTISNVGYVLPVKGKQLVLTPNQTFGLRGQYDIGPFTIGLQGKYTGQRYATDMNDQAIPGFTVVDLDVEWKLEGLGKNTRLQINANNIFNTQYFNRSTTTSAAFPVVVSNGTATATYNGSTVFYYTGAPTTVYATLKVGF
jgi:iron complex outermembrane receptor protein